MPVITPHPISAASAIGISLGIFTRPFCEVIMYSANEPTLANWSSGAPFQVMRPIAEAAMPWSLQRCGSPRRQ